ncbi:uncharacterized protein [Miscanthus floridulus]|uniref:uncharacterized protein n=1 Tax=Miscanthus floridulus TaxID=154761 RepID=UPI003457F35C
MGLAGGAGSSSFSGGRRMARRFSSSSGWAGRWAWVGGVAGAGHLRRVEASGGVGLLRWPAPPPSSSGGRGPGACGVAVAAGRAAAAGRGATRGVQGGAVVGGLWRPGARGWRGGGRRGARGGRPCYGGGRGAAERAAAGRAGLEAAAGRGAAAASSVLWAGNLGSGRFTAVVKI